MMKHIVRNMLGVAVMSACGVTAGAQVIVSTDAYTWENDTIRQGKFSAYAPGEFEIVSDYEAQPGYFMPIEKSWHLRNDISSYPRLEGGNKLHRAIYNMGLDEMVNAVEPDTTLRTGKEWAGVWTRDVSYSIILSMAYLQPEASRISLMKKVTPEGRIVQDTGSGGAWPVSSDRMIWAVAAWELYKVTGDKKWLEYAYPIVRDSFADDFHTIYSPRGLVKGETSFIDWREQSYPKWMQTADIYQSEALGTTVVHARALQVLAQMARELGKKKEAAAYEAKAAELTEAINREMWMDDKGYYGMYFYGQEYPVLNPRAETLGESLAILWDVASADRARTITESNPTTPFGAAIFYPQIKDMPAYHNNALWPWVASYWGLANAKVGNEQGTLEAIGSVFRPAALFATNKENLNLDNGDIATELNSSNMLWCLAGNIALTHRVLFGIEFEKDGLVFHPFVPKALAATRSLKGFRYRNAVLNITVEGYGSQIASFTINGKESRPFIPAKSKGELNIVIRMADNDIEPMKVNHQPNAKAPLTPVVWVDGGHLAWQPIEYIASYEVLRNGKVVDETRTTTFPLWQEGVYQVVGVDNAGVRSFASRPVRHLPVKVVEMPEEQKEMKSSEVSYQPKTPVTGYSGRGFVDTDHSTPAVNVPIKIDEEGNYLLTLRYANGNGPVNTENKCAIRTVLVDGVRIGVVVMPQRGTGNWDDWGESSVLTVPLTAGAHTITIEYRPENENMNGATNHALIDNIRLMPLSE